MKRKIEDRKNNVDDKFTLLLAKTKVEDLNGKMLVTCFRDDNLAECMKKVLDNKVSSLVVLTDAGLFYGFVDILDVVKYVVDIAGEGALTKSNFELEKLEEFRNTKIRQVMKNSESDTEETSTTPTLIEGQSLLTAVELLKTGVHRVAVVDKDRRPIHLVTQSSVVKFLFQNLDCLGAKQNTQLGSMGDQFILSVSETERAIDAFKIIKICRVSAVAVVNKEGKLVGNISASDLTKIVTAAGWISHLFQEVKKFIKQEPISMLQSDTLADALKTIVENKIHRVYVVDSENKPRTVVALTDVLRELVQDE